MTVSAINLYLCFHNLKYSIFALVGTPPLFTQHIFDIPQALLHSRLHRIPILVIAPSVGQSTALIQ